MNFQPVESAASFQNINNVALENAPGNAQYIFSDIQKDILHIFARKVRATIQEEIEISSILSRHNLNVQNLRGQGYDRASNMRGEWNRLQALFLKDCPFAYYIHCLAHRLQLALVSAAKELKVAQANNVANLIANGQIVTVFEKSTEKGNFSTHGDVSTAYDAITSFEFVFVLHLMINILEVSHDLCHALQQKNQDILNAFTLVSTTKTLIQRMRESSWKDFIKEVILFCEKHEVQVPDMNALHIPRRGRTRKIIDPILVEHHYRVNLFMAVIDTQLQELNGRFNDNMVELLILSSTLDPRNNYKFFNVNKVCELVERFYPSDLASVTKRNFTLECKFNIMNLMFLIMLN
ncbi:uncharacterized protein [Arachis hypogaea]|uniref:uncharacterized protein n=1 Tax=Arachis hypogaea TaxID=3818 RepID=UPI000DEC9B91|nr:zinc finger MYM-type protein 1-like [Arachis hypogaea]